MKLYEITERYQNLMELMDNEEVPQDMVLDALAGIEGEFEEKADNLVKIIKTIEAECEVISVEEKRLGNKKKSMQKKVDNLKDYLKCNMLLLDKKKIKTPLFNIAVQKNPPSINITDESKIREEFIIVTKAIDKKAILSCLKDGQVIDGAEIKQGESLRIR